MEDMTIFNLCVVNKGALKATVSIRLGNDLIMHDCKITQHDGVLSASLPQRSERQKGGEVVQTWPQRKTASLKKAPRAKRAG